MINLEDATCALLVKWVLKALERGHSNLQWSLKFKRESYPLEELDINGIGPRFSKLTALQLARRRLYRFKDIWEEENFISFENSKIKFGLEDVELGLGLLIGFICIGAITLTKVELEQNLGSSLQFFQPS